MNNAISDDVKVRDDLKGKTGTRTVNIKVLKAIEHPNGQIDIRVSDNAGDVYWTELENVELD